MKLYESPKIEVVDFDVEDVIASSGDGLINGGTGDGDFSNEGGMVVPTSIDLNN